MALPLVAVVGRPNVGKSTLVNRLVQASDAIVHAQSGVTRDRSYHRTDWNGRDFMLVDTGGIEFGDEDVFGEPIRTQAFVAAEEADCILFLVDGKAGPQAGDEDIAKLLKRSHKPVFLVVNKMDNPAHEEAIHDFWSLGLGEPVPISATHGHGTGDLLDLIVEVLPEPDMTPEEQPGIHVAIIGKPNAGKSSLFNKLAGIERTIVSRVAGTTRDAIDTVVERNDQRFVLVDTAGLRRKGVINEEVEYYGFVRAMRAIDRADVALLVIDAATGITDQDQRVARFAEERGCGLIVLLNKWDLLPDQDAKKAIEEDLPRKLGFVGYAPVLRISALTGAGVNRIYQALQTVYGAYSRKIPTSALNKLLTELRTFGHTVSKGSKTLRVNYVTQTHERPPGFTFFCNHPRMADENFKRYLENRLRDTFDFTGAPIELKFKQKD